MKHYLVNAGNADDVKGSLRCSEDKISIEELQENLAEEKKGHKRQTVIRLLESAIKRKQKNK